MSTHSPEIIVSTSSIGMGNPATAEALATLLEESFGNHAVSLKILDSPLARLAHLTQSVMTHHAAKSYTQNDAAIRTSLPAKILGQQLFDTLVRDIPKDNGVKNRSWVAVQEHQLSPCVKNPTLLDAYFSRVYLYIPDMLPKENAVNMLKALGGRVEAVVWNKTAHQNLRQQGIVTHLLEPVLPTKKISGERKDARTAIIKESGTGMAKEPYTRLRTKYLEQYGQLETMTRKRKIVRSVDQKTTESPSRLEHYNYLSEKLAVAIGSHPSEMVMVIAKLVSQGWSGQVDLIEPRGKHEKNNLVWLAEQATVIHEQGGLTTFPKGSISQERINDEIGHTKLVRLNFYD